MAAHLSVHHKALDGSSHLSLEQLGPGHPVIVDLHLKEGVIACDAVFGAHWGFFRGAIGCEGSHRLLIHCTALDLAFKLRCCSLDDFD